MIKTRILQMWSLAGPRVGLGNEQGRWFWAQEQTDKQLVYTCLMFQFSKAHIHARRPTSVLYLLLSKHSESHSF